MKQYNSEISKLDNLELVQISKDRDPAKALEWAVKESFSWPTIMMTDIEKTLIKDIKTNAVPTYVLIDKDGKEFFRAHDSASVMTKFKEIAK